MLPDTVIITSCLPFDSSGSVEGEGVVLFVLVLLGCSYSTGMLPNTTTMNTQITATAVGTITLLPNGLKRGRKTKSNRPTKARTTICRPLKTTLNNLRLGDPKKNETCVNTLTSKTTVVVRWIQVRRRVGDRPREHTDGGWGIDRLLM